MGRLQLAIALLIAVMFLAAFSALAESVVASPAGISSNDGLLMTLAAMSISFGLAAVIIYRILISLFRPLGHRRFGLCIVVTFVVMTILSAGILSVVGVT